jgi:hypothetical protein
VRATYHRSLLPAKVSVAHLLSAMSVATGIDFETTSLVLVLGIFFLKIFAPATAWYWVLLKT